MGNGMASAAPFRRSEFFSHLYQRVTLADREVRTELFRSLATAFTKSSGSREAAEALWPHGPAQGFTECLQELFRIYGMLDAGAGSEAGLAAMEKTLSIPPAELDRDVRPALAGILRGFAQWVADRLKVPLEPVEGPVLTAFIQRNVLKLRLQRIVRRLSTEGDHERSRDETREALAGHVACFYPEDGAPHLFTGPMIQAICDWLKVYASDHRAHGVPTLLLLGPTASGKSTTARLIQTWLAAEAARWKKAPDSFRTFAHHWEKRDFTGYEPKDFEATLSGVDKNKSGIVQKSSGDRSSRPEVGILTKHPTAFLFLDEVGSYDPQVLLRLRTFIDDAKLQRLWNHDDPVPFRGVLCLATNRDFSATRIFPVDLQRRLRNSAIRLPSAHDYLANDALLAAILDARAKGRGPLGFKFSAVELLSAIRRGFVERIAEQLDDPNSAGDVARWWFERHGLGVLTEVADAILAEIELDRCPGENTIDGKTLNRLAYQACRFVCVPKRLRRSPVRGMDRGILALLQSVEALFREEVARACDNAAADYEKITPRDLVEHALARALDAGALDADEGDRLLAELAQRLRLVVRQAKLEGRRANQLLELVKEVRPHLATYLGDGRRFRRKRKPARNAS